MKRSLLLAAILGLLGTDSFAQASFNSVGQTNGATYVSLLPAVTLTGQAVYSATGGGTSQDHSLDFDGDGRMDLTISASGYASAAGRYPSHSAGILSKHTDIEAYAVAGINAIGPTCMGLAGGDTLQPLMHRRNATGMIGAWNSGAYTYNGTTYFNGFTASGIANGANGQYSGGDWLDKQEHYVGFRLRAGATAAWRYGWLLLQVTSTSNPATAVIKSYALAGTPLAARSALAAGWQVYPLPTTDYLTIVPPVPAAGCLAVRDLSGRLLLQTVLTGYQQAVSLESLAAGVYVLELETTGGRVSQRIAKY